MTPAPLLSHVEGALTAPGLTLGQALQKARAWAEMGVPRLLAPPWLLSDLAEEGCAPGLAGAVAFPSGGATLTNKRVELLECVRLGATAATAVLTPGRVAAADGAGLEAEMTALLSTAPELQVRFLTDLASLSEEALTVLVRLLAVHRPSHVVTADGVYGTPCGPEAVARLRARLTKKVRIMALAPFSGPGEAEAYLKAGADLLCTPCPERLLEVAT